MIGNPTSHRHKNKYYVLLTTIVIGAILVIMLINEDNNFLTNAVVGEDGSILSVQEKEIDVEGIVPKGERISLKVELDTVPKVSEGNVKAETIELKFRDLSAKIKVNEEELELQNLEEVDMLLEGFDGELEFDYFGTSATGEADRLVVNGISFSTKGTLEVSFKELSYDSLEIVNTKFESLNVNEGSGSLNIQDKLDYKLNDEELLISGFQGGLFINGTDSSLEGEVDGFSVTGRLTMSVN
ncbi:hypothetical protein HOC13_01015 [Candidatus Woesearchaeota archaeon]|jgi:hypothetical protein|nr:hypothetical protein [Candidatus Woesearchaeota archaeon]